MPSPHPELVEGIEARGANGNEEMGRPMTQRTGKQERQRRIVAELQANPTVRISTLAEEFAVSTETVRRDIDELSDQGLVSRTYGGAAATSMSLEPTLDERAAALVAERESIARRAVALLQPGEVVMVDSGSTTVHFARRLAVQGTPTTVITNAIGVVTALGASEAARVLVCPGTFVPREQGIYGSEAIDFLDRYHADRAVLSASGLTRQGVTDADSEAAWIKRKMIERAERRTMLVDHSKFDLRALAVVCPLEALDELITDRPPPTDLAEALRQAGVTVHLA